MAERCARRRLERGDLTRDALAAISPNKMRSECIHAIETRARQRVEEAPLDMLPIDGQEKVEAFVSGGTTLLFDFHLQRRCRKVLSPRLRAHCAPQGAVRRAVCKVRGDMSNEASEMLPGASLLLLIGWMEQYQEEVANLRIYLPIPPSSRHLRPSWACTSPALLAE